MTEILKNIHRIELPTMFGMKTVNSFLIKGDEAVLIDCGEDTDESFFALTNGIKEHGLRIEDIDRIIITHAHVDHIGMTERVAKAADAKVWCSELVHEWALDPKSLWSQRDAMMLPCLADYFEEDMRGLIYDGYHQMMDNVQNVWYPISPHRIELFDSEGSIEIDGQSWDTIYMPGHSGTQSTFYHSDSRSYLSADMLMRITPTPVLEPSLSDPKTREKGILKLMKSYRRLLNYDLGRVYPGHYEIFDNAHETINRQVTRINQRAQECHELISKGHHSFLDIFNLLYKGRFHLPALIMLVGYLDLLEDEGKIEQSLIDGYINIMPIK